MPVGMLLQVQGIHLRFFRLAHCFLSNVLNQFAGSTGGDIIKTYLLLKETPGKKTGALLGYCSNQLISLIRVDARNHYG